MKKLKVVILSLFTLVLGTVLCACCNFKDAKASFSQSELVLSANSTQEEDLDKYLSVEGISKADVELKFNDSSLFSVNGHKIKALPSAAGQTSYVYAMYKNNSLASMRIVVTSPFDKPENFNVNENGTLLSNDGLLTWDAVSTFYANEKTPTLAQQYSVSGQWLDHDDISATVDTNSYQLPGVGQFNLKIKALANGHLDDSSEAEVEVFYGYMPAAINLKFENGVLSWEDDTEGAQYKVEIDGIAFDDYSTQKTKDLKARFDAFEANDYSIKVISHDPNNVKFDMRSSELVVTKLAAPQVSVVDGKISLSQTDDRANYYMNLKDQQNYTQTLEFDEKLTGFSGKYTFSVYATAKEDAQGVFYQSKNSEEKQIYKLPKVTVARDGENPIGGDTFNIKITGQADVDTQLKFTGVDKEDVAGFGESTTTQNVSITLEEEKLYTITVRQSASSTEELLVVDSDESEDFEVTKIAAFMGAVKHEYIENKSRFTFAGIDGVEDYDIQLIDGSNGEEYVTIASVHSQDGTVVYDFDGKIEDIENTSGDVYKFRIVAKAQDGVNAISSFISKELTLLSTPVLTPRENTQKRFEWTGNASKYEINIYKITKEQYTSSQEAGFVADASNPQTQTVEENFIEIDEVGYYFITIQSISTSEDMYISSAAPLNILAIVAVQLEMSEVVFGFDSQHNEGAYYLDITTTDDVKSYSLTIKSVESSQPKLDTRVYFAQTFDEETEVGVVAKGDDDDLYLSSAEVKFTVTPLQEVTMADFQIDNTCSTLSMKPSDGTTRTMIKRSGVSEQLFDTYTLSTIQEESFVLEFTREGADILHGVDVKTTELVYIPSKTSQITFNRILRPTNFRYENDLKFDEVQAGEAAEYVLDILCETKNEAQYTISVRIPATSGEVKAVYEGEEIQLEGQVADFMTTEELNSTRVLKLSTIIEKIKASKLSTIYAQATSFTFSVYAYQNREKDRVFQIASLYAQTNEDASTSLKIEKMTAPVLTYDKETNSLQWANSSVDGSSYVLYSTVGEPVNLEEQKGLLSQSYSLAGQEFEVATVYSYYIVAKNPKYLESGNSNTVNIQRLAPVTSVALNEDKLTFSDANSVNLYSKVQYQFDEKGFNDVEGNSITLPQVPEESSTLYIQYVGKEDLGDSENNYYLDSAISSWTLKNMSALATEELTVTFEKNKISWTEFSTLPAVDYAVVFTATSCSFKYILSTPEFTLDETNAELLESISNLSAGEVNVKVYAHLKNYTIPASGDVYYANLIEEVGCNYHAYSNEETIQKYATPQVVDVKFEDDGDYAKAQKPKIVVTFTGEADYDDKVDFVVMLNGQKQDVTVTHEENYTFTIEDYEKQDMTITIQAVLKAEENVFAIASTVSQPINIVVANAVSKIEFVKEEESEYLTRMLDVEFDELQALGGIVLALTYDLDQIEYDLKDVQTANGVLKTSVEEFVNAHYASGGKITASAFVNNYVNMENRIFIMASESASTGEIDVLKQLVKENDIQESSSGFKITNPENDAVYLVEIEGVEDQILSAENDYTFAFPDFWDGNQSHEIKLTAKRDGAISSLSFTFTFNLVRVKKVENMHFTRTENNEIKLVWDANGEAKEYKVAVYLEDEKKVEKVVSSAECSLIDLFGENYSGLNLTPEQISSGVQLKFGIVAVPSAEGSNDSMQATLEIALNGIELTADDIDVNEFGVLYFNSITQQYIYRLKTREGVVPEGFDWTVVEGNADKTLIDTNKLELDELFNVEIAIAGNLSTTLDSLYVTTHPTKSFNQLEQINSIETAREGEVQLTLEKIQNFIPGSCVYIGTTEGALLDGNVLKVEIENTSIHYYTCNFIELIEKLQEENILGDDFAGTLYFWVGAPSTDREKRITSTFTSFELDYNDSMEFEIIKINDDVDDDNKSPDYVNSYAKFNTDETILGVYVRITKMNDAEKEYKQTKYIEKKDFDKYFDSTIVNLTALFDNPDDELSKLNGEFKIELCVLKSQSEKYDVSKWTEIPTLFVRIGDCSRVNLNKGVLTWDEPLVYTELVDSYLIYLDFFKVSETNEYIYSYTRVKVNNKNRAYYPSSDVAEEDRLNIGVRAVSKNPYVISNAVAYYSQTTQESETEFRTVPRIVFKNSMAPGRQLELTEDGSFVINWKTGSSSDNDELYNMYNAITSAASNLEDIVAMIFSAPFTFRLQELVNYSTDPGRDNPDKTTFQFRFKKLDDANGIYKYFDVDAFDLLAKFLNDDPQALTLLKTKYDYVQAASDSLAKQVVLKFFQRLTTGDHGIANAYNLFDDYFEGLQNGGYTLEYCIVGNSTSLTSVWYQFESETSKIYVNEQPDVKVLRKQISEDESVFATQVVIKKSKIYEWKNGNAELVTAEKYGVRFGSYTMLITSISPGKYSLTLSSVVVNLNQGRFDQLVTGNPINVYECDENGTVTEMGGAGEYLMFYVNNNGKDSLVGSYGQDFLTDEDREFEMQVYAVGNNISLSSKSEYSKIVFLNIMSFAINDGQFLWKTRAGSVTNIYAENGAQKQKFSIPSVSEESNFKLDDYDGGTWTLKFVVQGFDSDSSVKFVDSNVYVLENVYKLYSPKLSVEQGNISVNSISNNPFLAQTASQDDVYRFQITNNKTDLYMNVNAVGSIDNAYVYEPGITDVDPNDPDYRYKSTEVNAQEFRISSLGTTTTFTMQPNADGNQILLLKNELSPEAGVAMTSEEAKLSAAMLNSVEEVSIQDGVVSWNEVTGTTSIEPAANVQTGGGNSIVYKVRVTQYKNTAVGSDAADNSITTQTPIAEKDFYTISTSFDFANLKENDFAEVADSFFRVRVQALALRISTSNSGAEIIEKDTDGRTQYASGFVTYADSRMYALISNGVALGGITRMNAIEGNSISVVDGCVTWQYKSTISTVEDLKEQVGFVVAYGENNIIDGEYDIIQQSELADEENKYTYVVTFKESKEKGDNHLPSGQQTLYIYTSAVAQTLSIKSYPRTIDVVKLERIVDDSVYEITTKEGYEELSLKAYFDIPGNEDNRLAATIGELTPTFDKDNCVLYIVDSEERIEAYSLPKDRTIVVTESDKISMQFIVKKDGENILYSDPSEEFFLQRSTGIEVGGILWDATSQKFTWEYENEEVPNPTFYVTVEYGEIKRIYTITSREFTPTIISDDIKIGIRVKLNNSSVLSQETNYDGESANFNLFASGNGTQSNPYIIMDETQFKNLQYRMNKNSELTKYTNDNSTLPRTEESKFYFKIEAEELNFVRTDESDLRFSGVLIQGDFAGIIDGNNSVINYNSVSVGALSSPHTVDQNDTRISPTSPKSNIQFLYGTGLFETISGEVKDLNISAQFKGNNLATSIEENALVGGLTIFNSGKLTNIKVTNFNTTLYGSRRIVIAYGGIVAINQGSGAINSCALSGNINITDNNFGSLIFFGGICYTDYGSGGIQSCTTGESGQTLVIGCNNGTTHVQIAGIVVTSLAAAAVRDCTNNYAISINGVPENVVYACGIAVLVRGTFSSNQNNGGVPTTVGVDAGNVYTADLYLN